MSYRAKFDAGHTEVTRALKRIGWPFKDVARYAGFGCDIVTRHRDEFPIFLEMKRPGPPSCRKLTESERELQDAFPQFYRIAQSLDEALGHLGLGP